MLYYTDELVAPRPLPITRCSMARSNVAIWNRKRSLQKLVEGEIKKTLDENPENEGQPKLVADRVALNVAPVVEERERLPVSAWLQIRSTLVISTSIILNSRLSRRENLVLV